MGCIIDVCCGVVIAAACLLVAKSKEVICILRPGDDPMHLLDWHLRESIALRRGSVSQYEVLVWHLPHQPIQLIEPVIPLLTESGG